LRVVRNDLFKLVVTINGGLNGGDLIGADVLGEVFAILVMLELVVRAGFAGTILQIVSAKLAGLHALDLGHLPEQLSWGGRICHNVPIFIGT
jgi:hypothetical protein